MGLFEPDREGGGEAKMWGSGPGQRRGLAVTMGAKTLDSESDVNQGWAEVSPGSPARMSGPVETALTVALQPDLTSGNSTPGPSTLASPYSRAAHHQSHCNQLIQGE